MNEDNARRIYQKPVSKGHEITRTGVKLCYLTMFYKGCRTSQRAPWHTVRLWSCTAVVLTKSFALFWFWIVVRSKYALCDAHADHILSNSMQLAFNYICVQSIANIILFWQSCVHEKKRLRSTLYWSANFSSWDGLEQKKAAFAHTGPRKQNAGKHILKQLSTRVFKVEGRKQETLCITLLTL